MNFTNKNIAVRYLDDPGYQYDMEEMHIAQNAYGEIPMFAYPSKGVGWVDIRSGTYRLRFPGGNVPKDLQHLVVVLNQFGVRQTI